MFLQENKVTKKKLRGERICLGSLPQVIVSHSRDITKGRSLKHLAKNRMKWMPNLEFSTNLDLWLLFHLWSQIRKQCLLLSGWITSHQLPRSRWSSTAISIGQYYLDNCSLRPSSQVFLFFKLTTDTVIILYCEMLHR